MQREFKKLIFFWKGVQEDIFDNVENRYPSDK